MERKPGQRPRVVLADDNEQILKLALLLLRDDYEVVAIAHNGQEAIEAVHRLKPDVVVLDIEMPVVNGVQAAKRLKEDRSSTKIVFLSGLEDAALVEFAQEVAASAFVFKAYISADLRRAISEALAGRFVSSSRQRK